MKTLVTPITTKTAIFSYVENDIILVKIMEDAEIGIEEAIENFEAVLKISNEKKYAVLIDAFSSVEVSPEARAYGSNEERQKKLIAQAILVSSLANKLIGNFILKFNKPYAPTKLFTEKETAMEWLRLMLLKG